MHSLINLLAICCLVEESLQKLSLRLLGSSDQLKSKDREIALKNEDILAVSNKLNFVLLINYISMLMY